MNSLFGYQIKDANKTSSVLWIDFVIKIHLGGLGLGFHSFLASTLGLPQLLIIWISSVSLLYSIFIFTIAKREVTPILRLRILVYANWFWTIIGIGIFSLHSSNASFLGLIFLNMQIIIAGGMAWWEGNQLENQDTKKHKNLTE